MAHAGQEDTYDDDVSMDEAETVELAEKHEHDDEMDMTAMIDITFLLLIFFVVRRKQALLQMPMEAIL